MSDYENCGFFVNSSSLLLPKTSLYNKSMSLSLKAYINATGRPAAYTLVHDIKRCLAESKAQAGLVSILSTQATTAVALIENDDAIKRELMAYAQKAFEHVPDKPAARRSGAGPDRYHLMAALTGLTLVLPFAAGRLMTNLQHDVVALDYEPKPGRREFLITVLPASAGQPQQGAPQQGF